MDLKGLMQRGARAIHLLRARGIAEVPKDGRYVVATNHAGVRGALLLGSLLEREIVFVGSARFLSAPFAGNIARQIGDILVSPGDMLSHSMLNQCAAVLERGALLGVMTEGRLMNGRYGPPKRGAAYLAARLNAELLPVQIRLKGPLARICVGTPLATPKGVDRNSLEITTADLARQLEEPLCAF